MVPGVCGTGNVEGEEVLILANFRGETNTFLPAGLNGNWQKRLDTADRRWGGPGGTVPSSFNSAGEVRLDLCAKSFSLFQKSG